MTENAIDIPRVQITLDSYVAELVIGMESRRDFGENRKEITNTILREWFRNFLKSEELSSHDLIQMGRNYIAQLE